MSQSNKKLYMQGVLSENKLQFVSYFELRSKQLHSHSIVAWILLVCLTKVKNTTSGINWHRFRFSKMVWARASSRVFEIGNRCLLWHNLACSDLSRGFLWKLFSLNGRIIECTDFWTVCWLESLSFEAKRHADDVKDEDLLFS